MAITPTEAQRVAVCLRDAGLNNSRVVRCHVLRCHVPPLLLQQRGNLLDVGRGSNSSSSFSDGPQPSDSISSAV